MLLRKGAQGPRVSELQMLLTQRGYPVDVTGTFDTWTGGGAGSYNFLRRPRPSPDVLDIH